MCVSDDRPRKKLSFREPEVVTPSRNGGQSPILHLPPDGTTLPPHSVLHHPSSHHHHHSHHHPHATRQSLGRPHSIAGIVGLGGFSALGGLPGVTNMTSVVVSQGVTSSGSVSGVTSMLGNPGLLSHPGILAAGQPAPILTPPTSPTHAASSQLPSLLRQGSNSQQSIPTSKIAPTLTPTSLAKTGPSQESQSNAKGVASQTSAPAAKMSSAHQPTSPTLKSPANPMAAPSTKTPVSQPSPHHGRDSSLHHSSGKSLPPSGSRGSSSTKPTKPASRNSSLKKQRSSPVQQAVTFLTEHGIVNGRPRGHSNTTAGANSLEDIDLEVRLVTVTAHQEQCCCLAKRNMCCASAVL